MPGMSRQKRENYFGGAWPNATTIRLEMSTRRCRADRRFLAELAGDGAALEFGVGTGRVGCRSCGGRTGLRHRPLARMVAQLQAKHGATVQVTIGDFDDHGRASSARHLVFNTIGNLTTQDQQVATFANAAEHLGRVGAS